jgi:hypothetical protein
MLRLINHYVAPERVEAQWALLKRLGCRTFSCRRGGWRGKGVARSSPNRQRCSSP